MATEWPVGPQSDFTRVKAWEFWPPWLFYAPVAAWIAALTLRHGLTALTAANPGLADGGLVGESKADILRLLPERWTIPWLLIPSAERGRAHALVEARGWAYPLVAKPDVGQRGAGVQRVADEAALLDYLRRAEGAVLLQPWHPGPFEAGVFYARRPDEARGRIFSITDKRFPTLVGDGRATVADLVRRHPRFRFQAPLFLARHAARAHDVLPAGACLPLGDIGNHAQGAMFVDGSDLITPALEARIDAIAREIPGFFVGRFDIRYSDRDAFRRGDDLAIVELNGVTAESTNIYDPSRSLLTAYRTLFAQWALIFAIGGANRARGAQGASLGRVGRLVWEYLRGTN